jgi:phosphinothricin acetyltransferase
LNFTIEPMQERHWPEVRRIYAEGLRTGLAAFASSAPQWEAWDRGHLQTGRLVACDGAGRVAGWSALMPVPDT